MPSGSRTGNHIGTLSEQSLHAALKRWYAQPGDELEVPVDGYIIDLVRQDLLVEIQTGGFSRVKSKLLDLVERHPVRLIYPITRSKWIVRQTGDGSEVLGRRKSPSRGQAVDLFSELVSFPGLVRRHNFALELLYVQEEEIRRKDGKGSWRRRGWSIHDRRLLAIEESVLLSFPEGYLALIPPGLSQPFTTRDLGEALGLRRRLAGQMAYCLRKMAVLDVVGKQGNAYLYATSAELDLRGYGAL
jgi:hypothetical protein